MVAIYDHLGRESGTGHARVDALLANLENATTLEQSSAREQAKQEFVAVFLLLKSDPKWYGPFVNDVENQYTRGQNAYAVIDILTIKMIKTTMQSKVTNKGSL